MNIEEFRKLCLTVPGSTESIQMTHDQIIAFKALIGAGRCKSIIEHISKTERKFTDSAVMQRHRVYGRSH